MIVDLLRNDLGRVCIPGSIEVPQLVGLESYASVHHLTSVVEGQLQRNLSWVDLLRASWPGDRSVEPRSCEPVNACMIWSRPVAVPIAVP